MQKTLLTFLAVISIAHSSLGVNVELVSSEDTIPLPNPDGSFSETSSEGYMVEHVYYIISEEEYAAFINSDSPSAAIYNAHVNKQIGEVCIYNETTTDGFSVVYLDEIFRYFDAINNENVYYDTYFGFQTNACFVALYICSNENGTYYIAEPLCEVTPAEKDYLPWVPMVFNNIAINAGRWEVIYNEPPSITCTDLCVTGGVVSATYSISEFSRLNEIVSNEETSVIVAADLARTTETNLAASVTATNSVDSTFTFSFNPAEQNWTNSTLFILGVEPPR